MPEEPNTIPEPIEPVPEPEPPTPEEAEEDFTLYIEWKEARRFARLHLPEFFEARFNELLCDHDTYKKAYLAVEWEHILIFGFPKYASYESFRISKLERKRNM